MSVMELLVFVAALFVLSVLAMRFGQDSRPTVDSPEAARRHATVS